MSTPTRSLFGATLPILFVVAVSTSTIACSSSGSASSKGSQTSPTDPAAADGGPVARSATPALRAAIDPQIMSTLTAAGIDPTKPVDLETLTDSPSKLSAVMESFTLALGTTCTGCHATAGTKVDYEAETPNKKVTRKMWSEFVRGLQQKDGSAIYCDSCHQGKTEFLDRADDRSLGAWMKENLVDKLARVDRKEHSCATCHGDPFDGDFVEKWSK